MRLLGVDPYLQDTIFSMRMQALSGFMARVHMGYVGQGKQVKHCTVSSMITAVGQMIRLACNNNSTKIIGLDKFIPWLQIMLDGYRKADPPTAKKLPVQLDTPELLVMNADRGDKTQKSKATADLTMIEFYYLLWVGEYMMDNFSGRE
jgi:hypothetical protein